MDPEKKRATDFLKTLGLTEYESKALCSLFLHSDITASEISQFSDIPVTKVYSILDSLEGKGLIRCTPSRPKKYTPAEPHAVLDALMRKQEEKLQIIRECKDNVTALLGKIYNGGQEFASAQEKVWIAPTEDATLHLVADILSKIKKYSYGMGDYDSWSSTLRNQEMAYASKRKIERGVECHIIIPASLVANISIDKLSTHWLYYFASEKFYVRVLPDGRIYHTVVIGDDRFAGFSFKDPVTKKICNGIAIEDASVAAGLRNYFEMLWSAAQPIEDTVRTMARKELETRKTK